MDNSAIQNAPSKAIIPPPIQARIKVISFEMGAPPTTYESLAYNYPWLDISNWNPGDIITVYPTQIIESILGFGIFIFLWNKREDITTQGSLFFIYLIIAGMERFFIEFIR